MNLSDLAVDHKRLEEICRRLGVLRLDVFGSFVRGDATEGSDLDVLVTFEPDAEFGLEIVELQQELESLLGRSVDVLTRVSVEQSPNKYFRRYALRETELLYVRR